jgi:hypothetical protein
MSPFRNQSHFLSRFANIRAYFFAANGQFFPIAPLPCHLPRSLGAVTRNFDHSPGNRELHPLLKGHFVPEIVSFYEIRYDSFPTNKFWGIAQCLVLSNVPTGFQVPGHDWFIRIHGGLLLF